MDFEDIFLPFNVKTIQGDVVIASPVYAIEVLFSERRKFSPIKFFRRIILVDAVNGASEVTKLTKFPNPVLLDDRLEYYSLAPQITLDTARFIAANATLAYEERGFGTLLMNWNIYPEHMAEKQLYRGYILRGTRFIDAFAAYSITSEKITELPEKLRKNR